MKSAVKAITTVSQISVNLIRVLLSFKNECVFLTIVDLIFYRNELPCLLMYGGVYRLTCSNVFNVIQTDFNSLIYAD